MRGRSDPVLGGESVAISQMRHTRNYTLPITEVQPLKQAGFS